MNGELQLQGLAKNIVADLPESIEPKEEDIKLRAIARQIVAGLPGIEPERRLAPEARFYTPEKIVRPEVLAPQPLTAVPEPRRGLFEEPTEPEMPPEERLATAQRGLKEYMEEPGLWQQIKDLSKVVTLKDPSYFILMADAIAEGLTLHNFEYVVGAAEEVAGKQGLYKAVKSKSKQRIKNILGYYPEDAIKISEKIHGALALFVPYSTLIKGGRIIAGALTKIPALKSTATGMLTGIASGYLRKPEEEGALNRLKQIPGDVLFFTAFETGILGASQALKIYNWNKTYKNVPHTVGDVRNLYRKMQSNVAGHPEAYGPMTAAEKEMVSVISEKPGWAKAIKEGFLDIPAKPTFSEIFRKPPIVPPRMPVEKPPEEPPPRPKPPTEPGVPPEKAITIPEPKITVDVIPREGGGVKLDITSPTLKPEEIVPKKALPPYEKVIPPEVPKERFPGETEMIREAKELQYRFESGEDLTTLAEELRDLDITNKVIDKYAKDVAQRADEIKRREYGKLTEEEFLRIEKEEMVEVKAAERLIEKEEAIKAEVPSHIREAGWSPEALARARTTEFYIFDNRSKSTTPLIGPEAIDVSAGRGQVKVQVNKISGEVTILDAGEGVTVTPALQANIKARFKVSKAKRKPIVPKTAKEIALKTMEEREGRYIPRARPEVKKPLRVKKAYPEEYVARYNEIVKIFDEQKIPDTHRGALTERVIKSYKPEEGRLDAYIKTLYHRYMTKEGEFRRKPTLKKPAEPIAELPKEEKIPSKEERPEDIFARKEEEVRVMKIIKKAAKNEKEVDILTSRILKGESYRDIAKRVGMSAPGVEENFKKNLEKLKEYEDVKNIIKHRMKQANLGPIPSKQSLRDFVNWGKKYFTSTKGVDKEVDAANDRRIQNKLAEEFGKIPDAKTIKKFLKKNKNPALDDFVLSSLKGEVSIEETAFPGVVKEALKKMRGRMDSLSQLIIAEGGLSEQTRAVFEQNIGRYIGKYYRLHQQKRWDPPKDVKNRFKDMLKREYPDKYGGYTKEELDNVVEGLIDHERRFGYGTRDRKTVPTDHYKHKKSLSPEWKELAGEYHDPVWLFMKTVSDQASMAHSAKFLNTVKEAYPDLWTKDFAEAEKMKPKGWQHYQLPNTNAYGELREAYVHPELYNYIKGEVAPATHAIADIIQRFITHPFKATKTIFSVPTQARNFLTNFALSFLAENLIFNPVNLPHYIKATDVFLERNTKHKKEWEKLTRYGVTAVQYYGSEIPKIQEDMMRVDPLDWADKIVKIMAAVPKFAIRRLGNLYNFNDVLFRIATFYKRTEVFKETPEEAIKQIDISLQNYRKLPEVVKILRKYPVFGPFVSFQWNMGKIMVNQALSAAKEIKSPNPKTKMKGIKRGLRLSLIVGIPAILAKTFYEVFDVDEKLAKMLEKHYSRWRQYGRYLYFRGKDGKLKALDLTFIWPTGEAQKATKAIMKGDLQAFADSIDLLSHPILDAISILVQGRHPYWGTKITGGFFGRMAEIVKLLWLPASAPIPSLKSLTESMKAGEFKPRAGALTPYQLKAILDAWWQEPDRYGRVRVLPEEIKSFFTGLRTWNVEPEKLILQSLRALKSERNEIKREYMYWLQTHTKALDWEIEDKRKYIYKKIDTLSEKVSELSDLYSELKKGKFLLRKED